MGSPGRPKIQKNAPWTPSWRGSENRRRPLRAQTMKTPTVTHFGGVQGTPPGSEKEVKIYTKMPAGPQNGVPENAQKNAAEKTAVRCRTCPTGGSQKGRGRKQGEINGGLKTGSRCSCAPTPSKAPSRVVFGDVLGMFQGLAWANRGGQTVLCGSATSPWLHLLLAGADAPRPFKKQLLELLLRLSLHARIAAPASHSIPSNTF